MKQHKQKGGSGRLIARLIRAGRSDDASLLAAYAVARNPTVANDNGSSVEVLGTDSIMVMRPTPTELIASAGFAEDGTIGLRFDATGKLVAWRPVDGDGNVSLTKDGKELWLRPVERYMQPKGARRKTRYDLAVNEGEHAEWVISLRGHGAIPPALTPDTRYSSFGALFNRLDEAAAGFVVPSKLRHELIAHGVDGSRTLEQCAEFNPQARVTRGKDAIAYGAEFLSGKTDTSGTAAEGSFVGSPDAAEMTMIAAMDANDVAKNVDDVLDMALSGMTMREIAKAKGHNDNKGGEEWAVRAVDRAIDELKKIAA